MADAASTLRKRTSKARDRAEEELRDQIASLEADVATISEALSELGHGNFDDLVQSADEAMDAVRHQTRRMARKANRQVRTIKAEVERNPAPAAAGAGALLLLVVGLVGYLMWRD